MKNNRNFFDNADNFEEVEISLSMVKALDLLFPTLSTEESVSIICKEFINQQQRIKLN